MGKYYSGGSTTTGQDEVNYSTEGLTTTANILDISEFNNNNNYYGVSGKESSKRGNKGGGRGKNPSSKRIRKTPPTNQKGLSASSREKEKTQSVNTAFTSLRALIPTKPVDRKLSKIETLRLATSYISHLSSQLHLTSHIDLPCSTGNNEFGHLNPENHDHQTKICTFCLSESKKMPMNMTNNINSSLTPLRIDYGSEIPDDTFPIESLPIHNDNMSYYY